MPESSVTLYPIDNCDTLKKKCNSDELYDTLCNPAKIQNANATLELRIKQGGVNISNLSTTYFPCIDLSVHDIAVAVNGAPKHLVAKHTTKPIIYKIGRAHV